MAMGGRKPRSTVVRLTMGNPGKRALPKGEPVPDGAVEKPEDLTGFPAELWDKYIARAYWLTWADSPKALMWCHLQAEYEEEPKKMIAARIGQLRNLGSELGLDPASRTRLGTNDPARPEKASAAEKYFDRRR